MCDDRFLLDALKRAKSAERGYADFDSWPDRSTKELGLGRDLAEALDAKWGLKLSDLRATEPNQDPPDLLASGHIGIEVTELVDQESVGEAVRQVKAGESPSQYHDWTASEFLARLREIVSRKDSAQPKISEPLQEYWLLIHTDEPGLTPQMVKSYLTEWSPATCRLLTRCFFLMSYFPGFNGRPVFELAVPKAA